MPYSLIRVWYISWSSPGLLDNLTIKGNDLSGLLRTLSWLLDYFLLLPRGFLLTVIILVDNVEKGYIFTQELCLCVFMWGRLWRSQVYTPQTGQQKVGSFLHPSKMQPSPFRLLFFLSWKRVHLRLIQPHPYIDICSLYLTIIYLIAYYVYNCK